MSYALQQRCGFDNSAQQHKRESRVAWVTQPVWLDGNDEAQIVGMYGTRSSCRHCWQLGPMLNNLCCSIYTQQLTVAIRSSLTKL